jgi:pimeloyl-ACP methyl ester carboxylesterase
MAARMFLPGLTTFWRLISRVHFDTISRVRVVHVPVWVSHGDRDLIIPVRMGREVFDASAIKGELLIVNGAGHNDVAEVGGRDYWDWLRRALGATPETSLSRDAAAKMRSEL